MAVGLRILAVDDEEALSQLLKLFLTRQQHHVTVHTRALVAREWFLENGETIELAIVDLTMPDMAGIDLALEMLTLQPALRVLLSSGYPFDLGVLPPETRGRVGFLAKPYVPRELQAAIATLFP